MLSDKLILDVDRIIYESQKRERQLILESEKREKKYAEKKLLEVAKNLLDSGMTVEQVKNFTTLPLGKIKGLQKQK